MLSIDGLSCAYLRDIVIVKDVSMIIRPGAVTAVIGPNGVGKSTLLKGIYGAMTPQAGRVSVDGMDITSESIASRFKRGLRYLPQDTSIFPFMTVEDNLRLFSWADKTDPQELFERTKAVFPILGERRRQRAGNFSGGQRKQLEFARFLCGNTRYALIDEPSVGLSPALSAEIYRFMDTMREQGVGILLVDQQVTAALELADFVYVIDGGQIIEEGSGEQYRANISTVVSSWLIH